MQYEVEYRDGIFFVRLFGPVERDAIIRYFRDLFGHPQWKRGALVLSDQRDLTRNWPEQAVYPAVERVVSELARNRDKLRDARIAAVYAPDSEITLEFGLYNTLLQYLKLPVERRVFHSVDKALAWLKSSR